MCPPTKGEFSDDFVNRYNRSISEAKIENEITINNVRDALLKNNDLIVPNVDSGFSFFCGLNPTERLMKLANESKKSPSQYYVDRLYEEKNILISNGEGIF